MMEVTGIGSIQPVATTIVKRRSSYESTAGTVHGWGQTCARHVYDAWMTEEILGIGKKFGG